MIRSAGGGKQGTAEPFMRTIGSPRAALLLVTEAPIPSDWPTSSGSPEDNLGHALGWTLEVRRSDVVIMNPLGEGMIKTNLPDLDAGWLQTARHDGSCAVFLASPADDEGHAFLTLDTIGRKRSGAAATVRTSVADDYGTPDKVGRNEPCPCGSGKKFKQCHG